jgi:transcriptional regulator with XRE-family HTH domain
MTDTEYKKKIGRKIKSVRNEKKVTLRELGKLCELDYSSICRIESGQKDSRILTLINIAYNLDVDVRVFL